MDPGLALDLYIPSVTRDSSYIGGARQTCAWFNKNESWIKKMHLIAALGIDQVTKTHICRIVKFDFF